MLIAKLRLYLAEDDAKQQRRFVAMLERDLADAKRGVTYCDRILEEAKAEVNTLSLNNRFKAPC